MRTYLDICFWSEVGLGGVYLLGDDGIATIVFQGDSYHNRIGDFIEGFFFGLKHANIEHTVIHFQADELFPEIVEEHMECGDNAPNTVVFKDGQLVQLNW